MNNAAPIDATFTNSADAMARLSGMLDRVGEQYGVSADVLTDLRIALDEVVSNILKYAFADQGRHGISIHWEVRDGRLETTIEDDGRAFDPLRAPSPDLSVPMAERKVGGLGIHFVKELMNTVTYERVGDRNRLTLKQDLDGGGR